MFCLGLLGPSDVFTFFLIPIFLQIPRELLLMAANVEFADAPTETQVLLLKALYVLLATYPPALQQAHEAKGFGLLVGVAETHVDSAADSDESIAVYAEV